MYPQGKAVPTRTKFQGIGVGGVSDVFAWDVSEWL